MILDKNTFDKWCPEINKILTTGEEWVKPSNGEHIKRMSDGITEHKLSIYIHIPFCKSICSFCTFTKIQVTEHEQEKLIPKYITALLSEIKAYSQITKGIKFKVTDIREGGGTPTLLSGYQQKIILEQISQIFEAEPKISIEANPMDLTDESYVFNLIDSGVHEVSLGVQSFTAKTLKTLGRRYSPEDSLIAIENLHNAGCENINIDLMYMVPGQSLQDYFNDLKIVSTLSVYQVSCYPTLIETWCTGYKSLKNGKLDQPDKKTFEKMVYMTYDILCKNGFHLIETLAYSRNGWKYPTNNFGMDELLFGFGCGAVGSARNYKYYNTVSVPDYIHDLIRGKLPVARSNYVSIYEHAIAYTMFNLFLCMKLDKFVFQQRLGHVFDEVVEGTELDKMINSLERSNYLKKYNGRIEVGDRGLFKANQILWAFMLSLSNSYLFQSNLYVC